MSARNAYKYISILGFPVNLSLNAYPAVIVLTYVPAAYLGVERLFTVYLETVEHSPTELAAEKFRDMRGLDYLCLALGKLAAFDKLRYRRG